MRRKYHRASGQRLNCGFWIVDFGLEDDFGIYTSKDTPPSIEHFVIGWKTPREGTQPTRFHRACGNVAGRVPRPGAIFSHLQGEGGDWTWSRL